MSEDTLEELLRKYDSLRAELVKILRESRLSGNDAILKETDIISRLQEVIDEIQKKKGGVIQH